MNTATTLLKREFWEHKGAFFWTPIAIAGLILVMGLVAILTGRFMHMEIDGAITSLSQLIQHFAALDSESKNEAVQSGLVGLTAPFQLVLFIVVVFYALGCLYDERKDRSILFWRSLPVSDSKTVLSKLGTALVLAPALYLAVMFAVQLLVLVLMTLLAWGNDLNAWDNVWAPAGLFGLWTELLVRQVMTALWLAPIVGWLMLVSAYVRKAPLVVAVLVPLALIWAESWFHDANWLGLRIGERMVGYFVNVQANGTVDSDALFSLPMTLAQLTSTNLWTGVLVAAGFIVAVIELRRRSGEV